jgi:predicted DCC family thiol-disulfide oxidoreductase YuxK
MKDIVFYDAACPLCSRVVRFILSQERDNSLFFSALQGQHARSFLPKEGIEHIDMKTFYLFKEGVLYDKSSAALRLIPYLRWYFNIFLLFWMVPKVLRDFVYNIISKYRYRLFRDRCELGNVDAKRLL